MSSIRLFQWRGFWRRLFPARVLARGLSLFLGGFAAVNLLAELVQPGFDSNLWWIDLRWLPGFVACPLLLSVVAALLLHAAGAPMRRQGRRLVAGAIVVAAAIALANACVFWRLLSGGMIASGAPVPLSLFIAGALAIIARDCWRAGRRGVAVPDRWAGDSHVARAGRAGGILLAAGCFAVAFAWAQMICFGKTDYSRRADAAIVFGARVYADGRMSVALEDRVRTGCDLFHQGLVPRLIFSGGPGDGAVSEPQAMRAFALRSGVPDGAILLDERGLSTQATVDETRRIMADHGITRTLAVSHFYHLPRIKLAYQRETCEVFTVPAKETYTLTALPMYMAREVAAWWWYYLRPVLG